MLALKLFSLLARLLTVMICWIVLMGVPLLFFQTPLDESDLKSFLALFYALLLATGTLIARSWGAAGLLFMAFPFLIMWTYMAWASAFGPSATGPDDQLGALNFIVIYPVVWLAWRLGRLWYSPAREEGRLL